jgi:hypothetical protein
MDELLDRVELRQLREFFLEEIFDGFYVVVRDAFLVLDVLRVGGAEVLHQVLEKVVGSGAERRYFGNAGMRGEALQPAYFDDYAVADQAVFAEVGCQRAGQATVAAVDR